MLDFALVIAQFYIVTLIDSSRYTKNVRYIAKYVFPFCDQEGDSQLDMGKLGFSLLEIGKGIPVTLPN